MGVKIAEEWEQLAPVRKGRRRERGVLVGMWQYRGSLPRLSVTCDADVMRKLESSPGDRFRAELGSGSAQRQYLRIRKAETGAPKEETFAFRRHHAGNNGLTNWYRILLPPHDRMPLVRIAKATADHRFAGATLVVTLPSWAWDQAKKAEAEQRRQRILAKGVLP